ncbi:MAG: hypothetical protein AB7F86_04455 [Bdellovibrionales bacterium]
MAKRYHFVSATIVLILASPRAVAAPDLSDVTLDPPQEESSSQERPLDDSFAITPAPEVPDPPPPASPRYYPYHQALTFRAGYDSDYPKISVDNYAIGFQYLFPKFLSPKLEAGADLQKDGYGHLHVGVRWFYHEKSYFRPSGKLALDHRANSENGIATLGDLSNYYLRGSATLEWVLWLPYSIRFEHEMLISLDEMRALLTIGISRGW